MLTVGFGTSVNVVGHLSSSVLPAKGTLSRDFCILKKDFSDQSHAEFYGTLICVSKKADKCDKKIKKIRKQRGILGEDIRPSFKVDAGSSYSIDLSSYANNTEDLTLVGVIEDLQARVRRLEKQISSSSSSSSSSSESSSSDDEQRVGKKALRKRTNLMKVVVPTKQVITPDSEVSYQAAQMLHMSPNSIEMSESGRRTSDMHQEIVGRLNGSSNGVGVGISANTVEVCMGKKCREKGANEILAALQMQEAAGNLQAAAIPCLKCMKKCKYAPNVKIESIGSTAISVDSVDDVIDMLQVPVA